MRKIHIIGDIGEDSFRDFCEKLDDLEAKKSNTPIEVELNSIGGNALDAIAFVSRMRVSPYQFNITVFGIAGSAAVLILAAGNHRRITRESWVMVHQDAHSEKSVPTKNFIQAAENARIMEKQWAALLEELTGTDRETWYNLHESGDLYLTPERCLDLKLVHEVI